MKQHSTMHKFIPFMTPFLPIAIASFVLTLVVVALEGATLWFSGSLINTIFANEKPDLTPVAFSISNANAFLKYQTWRILTFGTDGTMLAVLRRIAIMLPFLFLFKNVALYFQKQLVALFNFKSVELMRAHFYRHVLLLPLHYFDKNRSGNVASYLIKDITEINNSMTNTMNQLLMEPLKVLFFFGLLLTINAKLTLIVFSIYPLIGFVLSKAGSTIRKRSRNMFNNFAGIISTVTETVNGIRVVKMFGGSGYEIAKFDAQNKSFTRASFREIKIRNAMSPFTEVMSLTMTSVLIWYAGSEILSGTSNFGSDDFVRFLIVLFAVYTPIKHLVNIHAIIQRGQAAADRVFTILETPIEEHQPLASSPLVIHEGMKLSQVHFTYPGYKEEVLTDISFEIAKGHVVALVGSSGSGKSTILDLLPRFYDITGGTISIDGISTADMPLNDLRELFGIVSQDTILFDDTVLANIAYGDSHCDEQRVREALIAANALAFVEQLPEGILTTVGERGVTLSGGQRQRLAIARALYKNPEILILDEATSALDTESERSVQSAIDALIKDRTTIVVAHRLSTILHADTIIVLDKGKIVEQGTHADLIENSGRYKELYEIQFGTTRK